MLRIAIPWWTLESLPHRWVALPVFCPNAWWEIKLKTKKSPSPEHLAPKSKEKAASFIVAPVLSSATDTGWTSLSVLLTGSERLCHVVFALCSLVTSLALLYPGNQEVGLYLSCSLLFRNGSGGGRRGCGLRKSKFWVMRLARCLENC